MERFSIPTTNPFNFLLNEALLKTWNGSTCIQIRLVLLKSQINPSNETQEYHKLSVLLAIHTPPYQNIPPEVLLLREEWDSQQGVKVQTLHQEPEIAGHDAILEEHDHHLAAHLWGSKGLNIGQKININHCQMNRNKTKIICWCYLNMTWLQD